MYFEIDDIKYYLQNESLLIKEKKSFAVSEFRLTSFIIKIKISDFEHQILANEPPCL